MASDETRTWPTRTRARSATCASGRRDKIGGGACQRWSGRVLRKCVKGGGEARGGPHLRARGAALATCAASRRWSRRIDGVLGVCRSQPRVECRVDGVLGRTRVAHGRAKQGRTPQANSGGVARGEARLRRRVRRRDLRRERRHRLAGLAAREGLVRGPPRLQRVEDVRLQRVPRRVRVGPRAAHEHRDAVGAGRRAGREGGEQHSHASRHHL